jgi:hypothetical protein
MAHRMGASNPSKALMPQRFVLPRTRGVILVAQGLDSLCFPQNSRLPANLARMEGFFHGSTDAATNSIIGVAQAQTVESHVKTQTAELLLHLQHFELASA